MRFLRCLSEALRFILCTIGLKRIQSIHLPVMKIKIHFDVALIRNFATMIKYECGPQKKPASTERFFESKR